MVEKEPTPEELEEMRKKEARKDKLHQNYLKRKASGKQKEYEERTKAKKKAQIESQKEQIRVEDREKAYISMQECQTYQEQGNKL